MMAHPMLLRVLQERVPGLATACCCPSRTQIGFESAFLVARIGQRNLIQILDLSRQAVNSRRTNTGLANGEWVFVCLWREVSSKTGKQQAQRGMSQMRRSK
jgi:pyruvoyl-dependent arginine decarboxylase (PvlArgDC)